MGQNSYLLARPGFHNFPRKPRIFVHQFRVFRINPTRLNRYSIKKASDSTAATGVFTDGDDLFFVLCGEVLRLLQRKSVRDPVQPGGV